MTSFLLVAAAVVEMSRSGIEFRIDADRTQIDPARSVFLKVELKTPPDKSASLPDLRDRAEGFLLVEDFADEPKTFSDGSMLQTANWRLVPEACAERYKIRPFLVKASPKLMSHQSDEGKFSFVAGPVKFENPSPRDPVTGEMEVNPRKDLPPLSWRLVGLSLLALLAAAAALYGLYALSRYLARRVREHRMSPIERAWAELARLMKKGLPRRGRYKDFYVELTMVVRRYVQRRYGIKAPHLTTEEFLRECSASNGAVGASASLKGFLESADLVKFAGVEATVEMADAAAEAARSYLKGDSSVTSGGGK